MMLPTVIAWVTGSRAGRWLALAIVIGFAILWAFRRVYKIGKEEVNARIEAEKYKRLYNALKARQEIASMSDDERYRFVSRFLRH